MRKIKRNSYKGIYSSSHRHTTQALKLVAGVIVVCALIFVGYSVGYPIFEYAMGNWKAPSSSSAASSKASSKASSSKTSSASAVAATAKIRGAYLPKKYLSDTAALNEFITKAKAAGINLAIVDLKAEDGVVNYNSKITEIQGTGIVAQGAPDGSTAAKALEAAGITPAARICAFQDPLAPSAMRGTGVMYSGNHSINWLDPSNKRWLNPYNEKAQQYIEDLAVEAVSLGYKQIFVDSLTFPTVGYPDKSGYYGDNLTTKEQCIADFTSKLKQQVNADGGKLSVIMPGAAAIGKAATNLGQSQDIFMLSGDMISPNLCPSLLSKDSVVVGSTTVSKPDLAPGDTVNAIAQYMKTQDGDKLKNALPIIQDFTNSSLGDGYYKEYTASDVKAEITALSNAGIGGYILYSPDGTYDFSGIK